VVGSDSVIANFLWNLTVKEFLKSVNIFDAVKAYKNDANFWTTLYCLWQE